MKSRVICLALLFVTFVISVNAQTRPTEDLHLR